MDTTVTSLLIRIKDVEDAKAWAEFDDIYRPILRRYAKARWSSLADPQDNARTARQPASGGRDALYQLGSVYAKRR